MFMVTIHNNSIYQFLWIVTMNIIVLVLATVYATSRMASAFMASTSNTARALVNYDKTISVVVVEMIGGRGWDNSDYLSGLGGDDDDREKAQEDYKEFSDRRATFISRQTEIMKTPHGQAFLKQQQLMQKPKQQSSEAMDFTEENFEGSGGGTRMGRMMVQAKRMQNKVNQGSVIGGFNPETLFPLDNEDDDEEK